MVTYAREKEKNLTRNETLYRTDPPGKDGICLRIAKTCRLVFNLEAA